MYLVGALYMNQARSLNTGRRVGTNYVVGLDQSN